MHSSVMRSSIEDEARVRLLIEEVVDEKLELALRRHPSNNVTKEGVGVGVAVNGVSGGGFTPSLDASFLGAAANANPLRRQSMPFSISGSPQRAVPPAAALPPPVVSLLQPTAPPRRASTTMQEKEDETFAASSPFHMQSITHDAVSELIEEEAESRQASYAHELHAKAQQEDAAGLVPPAIFGEKAPKPMLKWRTSASQESLLLASGALKVKGGIKLAR